MTNVLKKILFWENNAINNRNMTEVRIVSNKKIMFWRATRKIKV